jgi:hypothetical protein
MRAVECVGCGRVFEDHATLRAHMRKKKHFLIRPEDGRFDRFYVVNWAEADRDWWESEARGGPGIGPNARPARVVRKAGEGSSDEDDEDDDAGALEEMDEDEILAMMMMREGSLNAEPPANPSKPPRPSSSSSSSSSSTSSSPSSASSSLPAKCLFCPLVIATCGPTDGVFAHMAETHFFSIPAALDHYHQVKLCNFVRWRVASQHCPSCDHTPLTDAHLKEHRGHAVPETARFEGDRWLLPEIKEDPLLALLPGDDDM